MPIENIAQAIHTTVLEADAMIAELIIEMQDHKRGIEIIRLEDSVQLRTNADYSEQIQRALKPLSEKTLSKSVLETLSIIAYKQPITRSEIEEVKGVSSDYSVRILLEMELICAVGKKDTVGRPILYGTTDAFLRHFDIASLAELPPLPHVELDEEEIEAITI